MSYWILEFIRVGIGYIFLMYLWPSVVFRKHLSGKSLTYRFAFCSTVSVLLINTLVLSLGLFHILDGRIVFFLFYGIFIASILKEKGFACVYPGSSENFLPESWAGNLSLQLWPMTVNIFSSHFSAD